MEKQEHVWQVHLAGVSVARDWEGREGFLSLLQSGITVILAYASSCFVSVLFAWWHAVITMGGIITHRRIPPDTVAARVAYLWRSCRQM